MQQATPVSYEMWGKGKDVAPGGFMHSNGSNFYKNVMKDRFHLAKNENESTAKKTELLSSVFEKQSEIIHSCSFLSDTSRL